MEEGESLRGEELGPGGNERGMGLRVRVLVKRRAWRGKSVSKGSCWLMCKMMASWQNSQTSGLKNSTVYQNADVYKYGRARMTQP